MTGIKRKNGLTRYYRCSHNANRGSSVCTNARTIRQDWIERAVLEALFERLFTPRMVEAILEEVSVAAAADAKGASLRAEELRRAIARAETEMENLRLAVKTGSDIEELVSDLREAKERKVRLSAELQDLRYIESESPEEIGSQDVAEAIQKLKNTLEFATPIERKELLKEHVTEIRVPRNGPALLEANPTGLLRCIELVTPRGVQRNAQLLSHCSVMPEDARIFQCRSL